MKFSIPGQEINILSLMRSLGYSPDHKENSFVKRLSRLAYPHFHIYVQELPAAWEFSLHLDQKGACYNRQTAHSGEYAGDLVLAEKERIIRLLAS